MILKIGNKTNISFGKVEFSDEEKAHANKLCTLYQNESAESKKLLFADKLFLCFDKHIKKEANLKAKTLYNRDDVLQEMYLAFFKTLNDVKENLLESLISVIDNFHPSKEEKNTLFYKSLDEKIKNGSDNNDTTRIDLIDEDKRLKSLSERLEEERNVFR